MKLIPAALLGAILYMALGGGAANADTITADLFSASPPSGTIPTAIDLSGITSPSQAPIAGSGYSIAFAGVGGNQGVVQGTLGNVHAVPVAGVVGGTTPEFLTGGFGSSLTTNVANSGNYLSTGLGTITITFSSPQSSLALLWGSIDTGNSLTFNNAANFVVSGTAVQAAAAGFVSNGFQGPGGSAYVVVNTDTPFTTVTATSSIVSFEFAGIAAATSSFTTVPEPANAMLIASGIAFLAFGGIYRRRQYPKV